MEYGYQRFLLRGKQLKGNLPKYHKLRKQYRKLPLFRLSELQKTAAAWMKRHPGNTIARLKKEALDDELLEQYVIKYIYEARPPDSK